jgi:hypothetical protein
MRKQVSQLSSLRVRTPQDHGLGVGNGICQWRSLRIKSPRRPSLKTSCESLIRPLPYHLAEQNTRYSRLTMAMNPSMLVAGSAWPSNYTAPPDLSVFVAQSGAGNSSSVDTSGSVSLAGPSASAMGGTSATAAAADSTASTKSGGSGMSSLSWINETSDPYCRKNDRLIVTCGLVWYCWHCHLAAVLSRSRCFKVD